MVEVFDSNEPGAEVQSKGRGTGQGVLRATAILGLARIVQQGALFGQLSLFLYVFGSDEATDALIIAQTLPVFFSVIFVRSFWQSFVPVFAEWREKLGMEEAWKLASSIFIWTILIAAVATGVVAIASPWIIALLGPGMSAPAQESSVDLLRVLSALIGISAVSSLPRSLYFSYRFYTVPAWTPLLPTLGTIGAITFCSSSMGISSVVWGTLFGWFAELVILIAFLNRGERRFRFTWYPAFDAAQRFGKLLGPRAVTTAVARINVIIDRVFASNLAASSISVLTYADALTFAPMELVAASFGTATLTVLSDDAAAGELDSFRPRVTRYLRGISFVVIPMTVLFVLLSFPLVEMLFGRGAFGESGVRQTATAVAYYSIGLLPMSIASTLFGTFFALQDSMTPLKVSIIGCILNVAFNALLIGPFGVYGLALSSTLCAYMKMLILIWLVEKKIGSIGLKDLSLAGVKLLAAASVMAGAIWLAMSMTPSFSGDHALVAQACLLTAYGLAGSVTFLVVCRWMGVSEVAWILDRFGKARRGGRKP